MAHLMVARLIADQGISLRTALFIRVVLPVCLILGVLLGLILEIMARVAEDRLERDLRQVARAVQLPVAQALQRNDIGQLSSSLASVFEISEVYGAYVFDVNGERLVSFGSVLPSRNQTYRAVELTVDIASELDQYEEISGRNVYSFFLPLYDSAGRPNGLLQVTRRRSDIEAELSLLRRWAWSGFAVVLSVMLGSLMLTHHRVIGRPLEKLLDSMQRIRKGERSHRAGKHGPRELQVLAESLNRMLDAMNEAEQQARSELKARQVMAGKLRHAETMAVLGQLSAGVAHELGAPLSVVDGRAVRLLRDCSDPGRRHELETIREQINRMSVLIEQLLSFGRNSRAPHTTVSLVELFDRVVFSVAAETGLSPELQPGEPCHVSGDMLSLEQALGNLLRNARQACPYGRILTGWGVVGDRVQLFVDDAGPGISPELQDQIFEPFVTSKLPGEGSGMGLAIVDQVVRDHGGDIRVESGSLGGARFTIMLPLAPGNSNGGDSNDSH